VPTSTLDLAAARLAALLTGVGGDPGVVDAAAAVGSRGDLEFEASIDVRPLARVGTPVAEAWAVDGGQAVVADARCVQLLVTRAARVRFAGGACVVEDEGELRPALVGLAESAGARAGLALEGLASDCVVDANLLRDRWEWDAVERCIEEAAPGALVLVDGDLQPDWRIPSRFLARLLARAAERGVVLAGVTKHSSLARNGAPLMGQLELEAASSFGARSTWWAPVGRTRPDVGYGLQVVAARLDPDAPYAFRVDLPADVDAPTVLGQLMTLCDDAAFPGYPYPLTVADRLAACPGWLRQEVRMQLDDLFDRAGVPAEVRQRAFADRHSLMERS
jgi:hypothetical protein